MELFVILPAQNRGWAQGRAAALRAIPFPRDEKGMVKSKDNRVSQVGESCVLCAPLPVAAAQLFTLPCLMAGRPASPGGAVRPLGEARSCPGNPARCPGHL